MIQELEMLALFTAFQMWGKEFDGFRVLIFTDSESVRKSFLKTWSRNEPCSAMLASIFALEEKCQSAIWLERVPSQSNPSDELSRRQVTRWNGLCRTRVDPVSLWNEAAQNMG